MKSTQVEKKSGYWALGTASMCARIMFLSVDIVSWVSKPSDPRVHAGLFHSNLPHKVHMRIYVCKYIEDCIIFIH